MAATVVARLRWRFTVHIEKGRGIHGEQARPFDASLEAVDGRAVWTMKEIEDAERTRVAALLTTGLSIREIAEETGLTDADFSVTPGWHAVVAGSRVALMKRIDVPHPAEQVRERMLRHLASEPQPELSDIRIVRSVADFDPRMPGFVTAYLSHAWGREIS